MIEGNGGVSWQEVFNIAYQVLREVVLVFKNK